MDKISNILSQANVVQKSTSSAATPISEDAPNDAYVTDVTYTINYKPEINPLLIELGSGPIKGIPNGRMI